MNAADKPLVSVIMPTHNRSAYLRKAIESVRRQTYPHWECIVVDDASSDDTPEVVQRLAAEESRVRYLRIPHSGLPGARNRGAAIAQGEFVAFLDDDDEYLPDKLRVQVEFMRKHRECGFVYGRYNIIDAEGNITGMEPRRFAQGYPDLFMTNCIGVLTVLCRRELLLKVGDFDTTVWGCEDYDMWLRMAAEAPFDAIDAVLANYRSHGGNISHNFMFMNRVRMRALKKVPIAPHKGITWERKRARLAMNEYRAARWCKEQGRWLKASWYFMRAVIYHPGVGVAMAEPKPSALARPFFLMKPLLAAVYCLLKAPFQILPVKKS